VSCVQDGVQANLPGRGDTHLTFVVEPRYRHHLSGATYAADVCHAADLGDCQDHPDRSPTSTAASAIELARSRVAPLHPHAPVHVP
jgi:hypothetical protein